MNYITDYCKKRIISIAMLIGLLFLIWYVAVWHDSAEAQVSDISVRGKSASSTAKLSSMNNLIMNLKAGKKQHIVTYGTSLTDGAAWVDMLKDELENKYPGLITMTNSGCSAMWSQWGVENLSERVLSKAPDALFIEFSINDAYLHYKTSLNVCRINLEYMIDRIIADYPDCEIILMVMNPPTGVHLESRPNIERYNNVYRDVALKRGVLYIDHYSKWMKLFKEKKTTFDKYIPDGIHPNALGCKEIILPDILKSLGIK